MDTNKRIRATCTWGDGPDLILVLEGKPMMLFEAPYDRDKSMHGFVSSGSLDLTAEEALELAAELTAAASEAENSSQNYEEHAEDEKAQTPQQQGLSSDQEGRNVKSFTENLRARLREKLL